MNRLPGFRRSVLALALALLLGSGQAASAGFVIGLPAISSNGNSFPFGFAYGQGGTAEYQQVYTASAFPGPVTIVGLQFFNTEANSGTTQLTSGNWSISLSTTSADWNSLSPTYADNIGADNTLVYSGNITQPWAFGNTLQIGLSAPFSYNPSQGNLLMDVVVSGASNPDGLVFFDAAIGEVLGRVYNSYGVSGITSGTLDPGYGLVTGFVTGTIPEPSSLVILGIGIASLVWARHRKSKTK